MGDGAHTEPFGMPSSDTSIRAADTRSAACSLRIAFSQCLSTVDGLMPNSRAICLDWRCAATRRRHSRSRGVSKSRGRLMSGVALQQTRPSRGRPRQARVGDLPPSQAGHLASPRGVQPDRDHTNRRSRVKSYRLRRSALRRHGQRMARNDVPRPGQRKVAAWPGGIPGRSRRGAVQSKVVWRAVVPKRRARPEASSWLVVKGTAFAPRSRSQAKR